MALPLFYSPTVANGALLPERCTEQGAGINPALRWKRIPAGHIHLTIAMLSRDRSTGAQTVHWLIYNVLEFTGPIAEDDSDINGVIGLNGDCLAAFLPPGNATPLDISFELYAANRTIDADCPLNWEIVRNQLEGTGAKGPYHFTCFYPIAPAATGTSR